MTSCEDFIRVLCRAANRLFRTQDCNSEILGLSASMPGDSAPAEHSASPTGEINAGRDVAAPAMPWFHTGAGQRLLREEARRLDLLGVAHRLFVLSNGNAGISFPRGSGREVVVLFPSDYPGGVPAVFARRVRRSGDSESRRVALSVPWRPGDSVSDVILPLLRVSRDIDGRLSS